MSCADVAHAHVMNAAIADPDEREGESETILPGVELVEPEVRLVALADIGELENVREEIEPDRLAELAESIRVQGLIHPVAVRPAPAEATHGKRYELIVGYRRLTAVRQLGKDQIPAVVHHADDQQALAKMITENLQRENLSPLAEARAMKRMMETFSWTQSQVAAHLGVHRTQVVKRLQLLSLPSVVRGYVEEGKITASHAEVVARMESEQAQAELAELAVRTGASVQKLNAYAGKIKQQEEDAAQIVDEPAPGPQQPLEMPPDPGPVTVLPHLTVRDDLSDPDVARAALYILLRAGNDLEMLQTLEDRYDVRRTQLWAWLVQLTDDQVAELSRTMVVRWLQAAHRFPMLDPDLAADLGEGVDDSPVAPPLLPDGVSAMGPEDHGDGLDYDELDEYGDDDF